MRESLVRIFHHAQRSRRDSEDTQWSVLDFLGVFEIEEDLRLGRLGRLVPVLPGGHPPAYPLWAVTPRRDALPAKVRYAIEAIQAYLLGQLGSRAFQVNSFK